jgi:hypothetical protein
VKLDPEAEAMEHIPDEEDAPAAPAAPATSKKSKKKKQDQQADPVTPRSSARKLRSSSTLSEQQLTVDCINQAIDSGSNAPKNARLTFHY